MERTDAETPVAELRENMRRFVEERNWQSFHAPKNICMALAVEVAELMEHFQWLTIEESRAIANQPEKLAAVAEEIADVFGYTLALANELGIDIATTVRKKMVKNAIKYPVEQYRGRYGPEDQRPVQ
jgi:dCTP diphosphatase